MVALLLRATSNTGGNPTRRLTGQSVALIVKHAAALPDHRDRHPSRAGTARIEREWTLEHFTIAAASSATSASSGHDCLRPCICDAVGGLCPTCKEPVTVNDILEHHVCPDKTGKIR